METKQHKYLIPILIVLVVAFASVIAWSLDSFKNSQSSTESGATTKDSSSSASTSTATTENKSGAIPAEGKSSSVPSSIADKSIYYYPTARVVKAIDEETKVLQLSTSDEYATVLAAYKDNYGKNNWKVTQETPLTDKDGRKQVLLNAAHATLGKADIVIGQVKDDAGKIVVNIVQTWANK